MRAILPFSLPWPPAMVTPYLSRMVLGTLAPSIESGSVIAVTTLALVVGPELVEVKRGHGGARGAARQPVALEDLLQTFGFDHFRATSSAVQRAHGRRERRVRRVLALTGAVFSQSK